MTKALRDLKRTVAAEGLRVLSVVTGGRTLRVELGAGETRVGAVFLPVGTPKNHGHFAANLRADVRRIARENARQFTAAGRSSCDVDGSVSVSVTSARAH